MIKVVRPHDILVDIQRFNDELNSWDYGLLIDGKKVTSDEDDLDFTRYKTIPISDVEKYHVGTCWDFVNYEANWFRKYTRCNFKTFFIQIDDDENCPSHTFLVFAYGGSYYYFESSWFKYQGIRKFDSYQAAVEFVADKHISEYDPQRRYPYEVFEYSTDGLDRNLRPLEFMDKVYTEGILLHQEGYHE